MKLLEDHLLNPSASVARAKVIEPRKGLPERVKDAVPFLRDAIEMLDRVAIDDRDPHLRDRVTNRKDVGVELTRPDAYDEKTSRDPVGPCASLGARPLEIHGSHFSPRTARKQNRREGKEDKEPRREKREDEKAGREQAKGEGRRTRGLQRS